MSCLDEDTVAALMQGTLSPDEEEDADSHLDSCRRCSLLVATVARAGDDDDDDEPAPERIRNRYLILEVLGEGGMGIVYSAYDRLLDRKIALKLVRQGDSTELLQEAHAMARLSHPNVVAVYDVGSAGGRLYIAMELVRGVTLRQWLQQPRRRQEILAVFAQAGRGLASAHDNGLVHRDFKPENVMVGEGGRAQVTDFGLARDRAHAHAAGTLRYMAPEQRAGRSVDARADQYSFCVALWEACFGDGQEGAGGLRKVLRRGKSADPEQRFPSMEGLLEQLEQFERPRRRAALAAGALLVTAAALVGWKHLADRRLVCAGGGARVATVWDATKKTQLHDAFVASGLPWAESSWATTARGLDAFAASWVAQHREACEATHVRREQSEELLDLRMACMGRQLREAGELVALLGAADRPLAERAPEAVSLLPNPAACERIDPLRGAPSSAVELTKARALRDAGRYTEALSLVSPLGDAESQLLAGQILDDLGRYPEAETRTLAAESAAIAARDDEVAAQAWLLLTRLAGIRRQHADDGHRYAALAEAAVRRLGGADEHQTELQTVEGLMAERLGHPDEAVTRLQKALRLAERWHGADHLATTKIRGNLAVALTAAGRREEALAEGRVVVAALARQLGPEHPTTMGNLKNVGTTLFELGRYPEAVTTLQQALAGLEKSLGPGHPKTGATLMALGNALETVDRLDEAVAMQRRALEVYQQALGPDHATVAGAWDSLCATLTTARRWEEALTACRKAEALGAPESFVQLHLGDLFEAEGQRERALGCFRRALAADEKTIGLNHADAAYSLSSVGRALVVLGQAKEGLSLLERARSLAPTDPVLRGDIALVLARARGETALEKQAEKDYSAGGRRGERRLALLGRLLHPGGPVSRR